MGFSPHSMLAYGCWSCLKGGPVVGAGSVTGGMLCLFWLLFLTSCSGCLVSVMALLLLCGLGAFVVPLVCWPCVRVVSVAAVMFSMSLLDA